MQQQHAAAPQPGIEIFQTFQRRFVKVTINVDERIIVVRQIWKGLAEVTFMDLHVWKRGEPLQDGRYACIPKMIATGDRINWRRTWKSLEAVKQLILPRTQSRRQH